MGTIRIDDPIMLELKRYGKSYNDSVKALLDTAKSKQEKLDYDYIRQIVEDCFTKHMIK